MGMFDGIEGASSSKGGVYLLPGNYLLAVQAAKIGSSRNKGDFFVVEFEIVSSDNPERPVGSRVSWMTMKNNDAFLGNVKGFAQAALDMAEDDITAEDIEAMIDDEQPLVGVQVKAQATNIVTRAGKDFTKVFWSSPS